MHVLSVADFAAIPLLIAAVLWLAGAASQAVAEQLARPFVTQPVLERQVKEKTS